MNQTKPEIFTFKLLYNDQPKMKKLSHISWRSYWQHCSIV